MTRNRPLPVRDGLNPTRLVLPHNDDASEVAWPTAFAYLLWRFPDDEARLREKVAVGEVVDGLGRPITEATPYEPRGFLWLYRDPPANEPPVPALADIRVLHRDENLLVVDKPHLVSVMPRGRWVTQTALVHLRQALNLPELSPAHRLDRPTAGVLAFTTRASARGAYQGIFQERRVHKVYEAVASLQRVGSFTSIRHFELPNRRETADSSEMSSFPVTVYSRIIKKRGVIAAQEVPGEPNAESRIDLIAHDDARRLGLFRLEPRTGKTHQLRLHMNSLGLPILHDPFWPMLRSPEEEDSTRPLQLLARSLAFTDPFTGKDHEFTSQRQLSEWTAVRDSLTLAPDDG
ncbi:MAG: pseudouridine synthase [Promicromonosporaceae bacterium]|nr:pseudouridine synthase [Promicromonosporaceae bacterium]